MSKHDVNVNSLGEIPFLEYERLQDYYKQSLQERKNLFEYYFKTVTLTSAAFGLVSAFSNGANRESISLSLLGLVFIAISVAGFYIYITYCKECKTADYLDATMERLRRCLRDKTLSNRQIFKLIDKDDAYWYENYEKYEKKSKKSSSEPGTPRRAPGRNIKWWRGSIMASINSAVFSGGFMMIMSELSKKLTLEDCPFIGRNGESETVCMVIVVFVLALLFHRLARIYLVYPIYNVENKLVEEYPIR